MKHFSLHLVAMLSAALVLPSISHAQGTPVSCGCSTDPATNLGACLGDIRALPPDPLIPNRVVNDIFRTSDGRDARQLVFATYYRGMVAPATPPYPAGTAQPPLSSCVGSSSGRAPRYSACPSCDCPSCTPTACTSYACSTAWDHSNAIAAHEAADHLDWRWFQLLRGTWESGWTAAVADLAHDCPDINDVAHCSYNPAYGFIYDLGGEANRVAVFAVTDHTDNCLETFEWTVWLSDNPDATQAVRDGEPPDPMKWNRARLDQIFLQGWTRNPTSLGSASDTSDLEDMSAGDAVSDSPTVLFSLPCGVTFRYASLMSGNFGSPGPHCQFDSFDDEVDALAGLNADNTRICPDADHDGYRDASCGGSDCNDTDPTVHPGAIETCSAGRDLDCDGTAFSCPNGTSCFQDLCVPGCLEGACGTGFTCVTNDAGTRSFCVPNACVGVTCPAGEICGPSGCQDPCLGAHCPLGQVCRGGSCLDPCQGLACPTHQHCSIDGTGNGHCVIDCTCAPCAAPATCNATTGRCDAPNCAMTTCTPDQTLDCSGAMPRCVSRCDGVTCPLGQLCDMPTGQCLRDDCFGVACTSGLHCDHGACVPDARPDSGIPMNDGGTSLDGGVGDGAFHMDGSQSGNGDAHLGDARMDGGRPMQRSGCGCHVVGTDRGATRSAGLLVGALGVAIAASRRRRRRG